MTRTKDTAPSRRDFLKAAASAAAFGPFFLFPGRALASQKTLKIAKWAHFLPEFDSWFQDMAREWGKQHDTQVKVDLIPIEEVHARAAAEVKGRKGHDVFMFPWPPAEFYQHTIDHAQVYQTVAGKYGQIDKMAHRSTFDWRSKQYFAFADSWIPTPFLYFQDYWGEVGLPLGPVHYDGLRSGGTRLKAKLGVPCGLSLTHSLESNITLHTLLHALGGMVLDAGGNVIIRNGRTVVALEYAKYLYQSAGSPEELTWSSGGNSLAMLARKSSCTMNAISLVRAAEKQDPEVAKKLMIQPPLKGAAGGGVVAFPHVTNCSSVWNFAQNQEGAKQFLADLIDHSTAAYEQSQGCNFPFYQKTVPDLIIRLQRDAKADPPYKYTALKDALYWTRNLGVPGYSTPAYMELFNAFVIPRMFISVVSGKSTPQEAMQAADAEIKRIAEKWKQV